MPEAVSSDGAEEAKQALLAQRDALKAELEQVQVHISTGCSASVCWCVRVFVGVCVCVCLDMHMHTIRIQPACANLHNLRMHANKDTCIVVVPVRPSCIESNGAAGGASAASPRA